MITPKLVPNPGTVLLKASSLWVAYGAFVIDVGVKVLEYIQNHRELKWQDMVVPLLLLLVPTFRVIQQEAVTRATKGDDIAKEATPQPQPLQGDPFE